MTSLQDRLVEEALAELREQIAANKLAVAKRFTDGFWMEDDRCGGQLCFRGTRIIVECVVGMFAAGDDPVFLAAEYGLPEQAIHDAIRLVLRAKGVSLTSAAADLRVRRELQQAQKRISEVG